MMQIAEGYDNAIQNGIHKGTEAGTENQAQKRSSPREDSKAAVDQVNRFLDSGIHREPMLSVTDGYFMQAHGLLEYPAYPNFSKAFCFSAFGEHIVWIVLSWIPRHRAW